MSDTTAACIRGCGIYRQHLTDCPDEGCRGCLPRRADHGHLCQACHRRLELMIHDAPGVYRWLTGNLAQGQGAATDAEHVTGSREAPMPIKAGIYDIRQLLADQMAELVDDVVETRHLTGPGRHTVEADAKFVMTWLGTIEREDWIGDWWEALADTMRQAHALAPWRPAMRRIRAVPCPGCGETNLAIFGGESDISCLSCRILMTEERFGLWERVLKMEVVT